MSSVKLLPLIVIGVAVGTLIALYVAYQVAQKQISQSTSSNALLGAALSKL
jgi:purine-cytosine permease-like protein